MVRLALPVALAAVAVAGKKSAKSATKSGAAKPFDIDYTTLCPSAPEIMLVQDSSLSLKPVGEKLVQDLAGMMSQWREEFPGDVHVGVTTFSDKVLPLRGLGFQQSMEDRGSIKDTCYDFGVGLSTDNDEIVESIRNIVWRNGGDLPEDQYEALLMAAIDPKAGWSPKTRTHDDEGRRITRIAVVITDDASHLDGDGVRGIMTYNAPWMYAGINGWGSGNFANQPGGVITFEDMPGYTKNEYKTMVKNAHSKWMYGSDVTALLEQPYRNFGPERYGPMVKPHPGFDLAVFDDIENGCSTYDYPSLDQVKRGLKEYGVIPVILVTPPIEGATFDVNVAKHCINEWGFEGTEKFALTTQEDKLDCLMRWYETQLEDAGITAVVQGFNTASDVTEAMRTAVLKAADYGCIVDPTEDETTEPIVPPVKPEDGSNGGSNTVVIAGASAGAAAGAALIAGLLWKKLGGSFLHTSDPEITAVEQVESPDSPLERETLEQVTVDMFQ